ncbi:MAG: pantoate--beta-alanine ligase [Chloroflexi bacterium]|nr:pantoate--beta-alanine ligase [Chloroflexota bacterium]|tara:strand:- start:637 stop:1476 length:840 start_codon:yes stop_codon:yes gene_type:complete
MEIAKNNFELNDLLQNINGNLGFVPTMGSLHEGHISLIESSKKLFDNTVVSIFVNPTQFGPGEDFEKYPRNENNDIAVLKRHKVDLLYLPSASDVYPNDYAPISFTSPLTNKLEGALRPGHFDGVIQVVYRLLSLVNPDGIFLGKKDAQQLKILSLMIDQLTLPVKVHACEIIRENNGLALSSRNAYLSKNDKVSASTIYKGLLSAKAEFRSGSLDTEVVTAAFIDSIDPSIIKNIDYVSIVDQATFTPTNGSINSDALMLVAVRFGSTRLIDNIELTI